MSEHRDYRSLTVSYYELDMTLQRDQHALGVRSGFLRKWLGLNRPRGTVIPFETPALRIRRVCDDERDGLIANLRDFANKGTTYIVPWSSLPLIANMTEHDMALHKGIAENRPSTPEEVRAVVSKLALAGALGPQAKAREAERGRTGKTQLADLELVLILHLLGSGGADPAALVGDHAGAAAEDVRVSLSIKRQEIYQRVSDFAKLLVPVGLAANEGTLNPGWLRVLHGEIEAFARDCASCAQAGHPDGKPALDAISKSAARTARTSDTVLSILDYATLDIRGTIRRWETDQPVLKQVIDRLSVMLDEWPALMGAVHEAIRAPEADMVVQLNRLRTALPAATDVGEAGEDAASESNEEAASIHQALAARLSTIWAALGGPGSRSG
jgi:hypothetical protein